MAHVLVPVDSYAANVTVPDDGDAANAGSVETPLQNLTDRVHHCRARVIESVGGVEPLCLGAAYLNLTARFAAALHAGLAADVPWLQSSVVDAGLLSFAVPSKIGCKITQIEVRVHGRASGAAHGGAVGTMPNIELVSVNNATGAHVHVANQTDTTVAPATYDVMHSITLAGLNAAFASGTTYYLQVTGEAGANSAADHFAVYAALITYAAV